MPSPSASHNQLIAAACRQIEASDGVPELGELAAQAGLSPWHFHRVFKAATGLTPRSYASARRAEKVREQLLQGKSVTETLYASGFNSSGRFYEAANGMLGMSPTAFRAGGSKASIHFALAQCSLGAVLVACSERGVCAILLGDEPQALLDDLQRRFPKATLVGGDVDFEAIVAKVLGFIEAPRAGLDLPLDIRGTAFQQRVWQALARIEPGTTASYAEVAASIGAPNAVRAVAGACAANALAVAVPCHRVLRTDGGLSGYRWGVERKRELLARERHPDNV
nr:bifunctional DNA-binding transcriptional regulator/O6-methylguanine-DNA methyltransferase Ada [uncultured Pseudomonas sp.]